MRISRKFFKDAQAWGTRGWRKLRKQPVHNPKFEIILDKIAIVGSHCLLHEEYEKPESPRQRIRLHIGERMGLCFSGNGNQVNPVKWPSGLTFSTSQFHT